MTRTPKATIRGNLRRMWLQSRERAAALKRDGYCCQECGVKQSKAKGKEQKVLVHHLKGEAIIEEMIEMIQEHLLCDPDDLETLCPDCHAEKHSHDEV